MNSEELRLYLPKYLSEDGETSLIKAIRSFPKISYDQFYTTQLQDTPTIYQGDGISSLTVVNIHKGEFKKSNCMVFSNTCDIDPTNKRFFSSQILYSPIVQIQDYKKLLSNGGLTENQINGHLDSIKKQEITQIFYLPKFHGILNESIVFLDRLNNYPVNKIDPEKAMQNRLFTLSDFGNYLFVFKLSIHFSRIKDRVERLNLNYDN